MCFRSERFHVGAFPPSATSNRASTGAGYTLDAFAPKATLESFFGDPWRVATARGVRASPGRRCSPGPFPLVKSDRESLLPAGSRRFPSPSAPMPWIATDRSKAATLAEPIDARANTPWTRARRRQRISPPPPSPRTRPMSIPAHIPGRVDILATEASHLNRRAQTSDARRRDGQGRSHSTSTHPHDTPRRRHAQRVVHAPRLGRRRHRKGGRRRVLLLRRREGGWRRVLLLLLPLFSPSSPTSSPLSPARIARGEEPSSTAPATKETEGRVDAAGGGFSTRRVPSRRPGRRVSRFASFVEVVVDAQLRRVFRRDGAATVQSASVRRGRVRRPSRGRGGRSASGNGISRSGARGAGISRREGVRVRRELLGRSRVSSAARVGGEPRPGESIFRFEVDPSREGRARRKPARLPDGESLRGRGGVSHH